MSSVSDFGIPLVLGQGDSTLSVFDLAVKGGVMMVPIALCSLIVVAVVMERASVLRLPRIVPAGFEKRLKKAMGDGGAEGVRAARELCKKSPSPASRVVDAGLAKMGHSHELIEKHMAAAGETEVYGMRKRLRMLSVIAAVAPLMGLTGTIFGMIESFKTVASSADALGKAELLAGGIYEAMITTAAGLLVAMPTVMFYHWLVSKVERMTRELDRVAVAFIERYVLEAAELRESDVPSVVVKTAVAESSVNGSPKQSAVAAAAMES